MTVAAFRHVVCLAVCLACAAGCETESTSSKPVDGGGAVDVPAVAPAPDAAAPDAAVDAEKAPDVDGDAGACDPRAILAAAKVPWLAFDAYHSQAEIIAYLQDVAAAVPEVATYQLLGQSVKGRPIPYLTLNATCAPAPPAILLVGTHHGDEWSSTEAALAHVQYLLRGDDSAMEILDRYAVTILPVLNPDGHVGIQPTRANANGVDLNRDYAYPGRDESASFTQPETRLMKALQEKERFKAALTFHSGLEAVFWPWCHTGTPTPDEAYLSTVGSRMAQTMAFTTFSASYYDYKSDGEYIDYAYMKDRTMAFTVEVSTLKIPPPTMISAVVATAWRGTIAFVAAMDNVGGPLVPVSSPMMVHAPRIGNERQE